MYQKNGVDYTHTDLKNDNPNVGFYAGALENADIRTEYGVTLTPKAELPPTDVQAVTPTTPDGHRAVAGEPEFDGYADEWRQTWTYVEISWLENRIEAYGTATNQLEFITENGLEAWQTKVTEIKTTYPKP